MSSLIPRPGLAHLMVARLHACCGLGPLGETIGVYGLDGERQAVLTSPPGLMAPGDYDPVWSADGASLMVPHGVEIPLDGNTPRKLPWAADQHALMEAYSPDGSRLAYMTRGSFVVAAADGPNAQEVFGKFVSRIPYGRQSVIGSPSPQGTAANSACSTRRPER